MDEVFAGRERPRGELLLVVVADERRDLIAQFTAGRHTKLR
jgi:hypothetical protein